MLRSLTVTAPAIAAIMVVVLLFEPPALRPSERIPTLHALRSRTTPGLDRAQVEAAIAWGRDGEPHSYALPRISATGDTDAAGVVYTPFLRVAWAAYARQRAGRTLTVDEVPPWMTAPVFYVAMRTPPGGDAGMPSIAVVPADMATCCREPQPTLVRPLWMTDDPAAIARFGALVPFSDLGVVAVYPMAALRAGLDFVAFHRLDGLDGPSSDEMRGRLEPGALREWR